MEDDKTQTRRSTLKLKSPSVRTSAPPVAPPAPPVAPRAAPKKRPEAASWADEHKHRMQADMDALGFANPAPERRR